jgi:hypothetical protein
MLPAKVSMEEAESGGMAAVEEGLAQLAMKSNTEFRSSPIVVLVIGMAGSGSDSFASLPTFFSHLPAKENDSDA